MPLVDTGTCNKDNTPHARCTNPSWKYAFKLSFKTEPGVLVNHGDTSNPFSFHEWFHSWDRTGDPDVRRLCEISWNASRAALRNQDNPDRKEILEMLESK